MADASRAGRKSDLGVRSLSALVMVGVAGTALALGGWVWIALVAAIAIGVLWEWRGLVVQFEPLPLPRGLWNALGIVYIGLAGYTLAGLRLPADGLWIVLALMLMVIATDIGAYFAGRTIGGPKIAPRISPSKTWSGLAGGIAGASLAHYGLGLIHPSLGSLFGTNPAPVLGSLLSGGAVAVVAQSGDFFESWMKRRAGVKDSGRLIPGHGGLFDRVDGLLAVLFAVGLALLVAGAG